MRPVRRDRRRWFTRVGAATATCLAFTLGGCLPPGHGQDHRERRHQQQRAQPAGDPARAVRAITLRPGRPHVQGNLHRNLKLLDEHAPDASYEDFIRRNAAAAWRSDRRGDGFGLHWDGPFDHADTARQAAALDVLTTQVAHDA